MLKTFFVIFVCSIFSVGAAVTIAVVLGPFVDWLAHQRVLRERRRLHRARPKGAIVKIGRVIVDQMGHAYAADFVIDCEGHIPAQAFGPDGEYLTGGYTNQELVEIAQRREEFSK